jgi:putative methionine-R-sulfoxide reductase with GAF domain
MFSDEGRRDVRETIARAIAHESDADEILREAVVVLYEWIAGAESVALAFVEDGRLVPGPVAGEPIEAPSSLSVPVLYDGRAVAELWVSASEQPDDADRAFGEQVAALLSPYCLVGWDTGGEAWEP